MIVDEFKSRLRLGDPVLLSTVTFRGLSREHKTVHLIRRKGNLVAFCGAEPLPGKVGWRVPAMGVLSSPKFSGRLCTACIEALS